MSDKFLVIGLGSMGKRRIRDLLRLKAGEPIGLDLSEARRSQVQREFDIRTIENIEEGLATNPAAVIISTPPDQHLDYGLLAARRGHHIFLEVMNVGAGKLRELVEISEQGRIVAAASSTMRFHPSANRIKQVIDSGELGRPLTFTYHFGQYLPAWHPWEDYRQFYAGKRETSGSREMIVFILIWITWLFGEVVTTSALKAKLSALEGDLDDVYQILLRFDSGVLGSLTSELVSHVPFRNFKLMLERGVVVWDWTSGHAEIFNATEDKWHRFEDGKGFRGFSSEDIYVSELAAFLAAIRGDSPWGHSLRDDERIMQVLDAVDQSATTGRHVCIVNKV